MGLSANYKLRIVTTVYWALLVYIVAALVWWFIALNAQNSILTNLKLNGFDKRGLDSALITKAYKRKTIQYIGEGCTFLVVIIIAAIYIYRATRRQIRIGEQQQNFMMAVTHELKTPISITRLNLETLQHRKLTTEHQGRIIEDTIQETERLNELCTNILVASQLDAGNYKPIRELLDLSKLVQACVQQIVPRAGDKEIISLIPKDVYIKGEKILIELLINNLIENAVKYTPSKAIISVKLAATNKQTILEIIDNGNGVPDKEKKKIFDKFYRSGEENIRTTKGTGLGLYLCKKIMETHYGKITVTDNKPKGSVFSAIFKTI